MTVWNLAAYAQNFPRLNNGPGTNEVWSAKDLIQPAVLAASLKAKDGKYKVINIGVVDDIPGAVNTGAASQSAGLKKLSSYLLTLPKTSQVVIYCGCCPFDKCPNITPAFQAMRSMGFKSGKLLNLPTNLKQDWISKGYPLAR